MKKNFLAFSDYLQRNRKDVMKRITDALDEYSVDYEIIKGCKDIWVRDFMPIQRHDGKLVKYCYRPDYLVKDGLEKYITNVAEVEVGALKSDVEYVETSLVIDGGNAILCQDKNGKNCVLMTQKVLFENSPKSHLEVLKELTRVFDADIILLPWDRCEPYGHADGMVRYLKPGCLLLNNYEENDEELFYQLKLALSARFELISLKYGSARHPDSWCHINFLELDNLILVPAANIPSDAVAKKQLEELTGKVCIPIEMKEIVNNGGKNDGGALNCISWNNFK
jgi:agmatine/peptidylarginine deiminase